MAVDESVKKISINYDNLGDIASTAIPAITSNIFGNLGGNSEWGRGLGTLFSQGSSSALGRMSSNLFKGNTLMEGVGHDALSSVAGAGVGLASYGIGQGINSLGGNSKLSRGIGAGVSTGLGIYGGNLVSNLLGKTSGVNPYGAAMTIAGSALGAAMGPSKEYNGTYGNITRTMDSIYDVATAASNFLPGGQVISGAMALNKGLSNLFGSTSGMTRQDAILGSAFMPAPVKWLNMVGAHTTDTFKNLSWLNTEKADSFMLNAFGNLNTKFDKAREEAGKTYGTFSNGAYRRAQNNIEFANQAWNKILSMADLNELQTIRSLYMTSINNLRYALNIQGGWNPLARGKYGMKILNNATNHNMGMRLLSGAALIDDKQMILSALEGIKMRPPRMRAHRKGDLSRGLTEKELQLLAEYDTLRKKEIDEKVKAKQKADDEAAKRFNLLTNTVMSAMTLQANETPFTGLEYLQAAELQRQEKVDKFHDAEKVVEATLMADMATAVAPLLRKGFRWAFNKAGLLVRVPKMVYSAEVKSPYYKIGQDRNLTFDTENVVSQIKSGKQDFINEILSPEYAEAAIRNMEEAEKMGLSYTPVFEKPAFKSLREDGIIPKFVQDPKHTWHARTSFFGGTPGKATEIEYNLSQSPNIRQATGHESGHVSKWGMGETKEEHEFMKYKASLIFKDEGDVGVYEFGSLTGEAATNMRDLGKQMGITQRTPYPGYEEALKKLKEAEVTSNKGGIVKVLKLTKEAMPHIWRALQGLHFEYAIPTALTATTLYNTNK